LTDVPGIGFDSDPATPQPAPTPPPARRFEYGLIAALIAVAGIAAMNAVGSSLTATFNNVSSKM
jgi:hypothetical protein